MESSSRMSPFGEGLLSLYDVLAGADPLGVVRNVDVAHGADGLLAAFEAAAPEDRGRWLLRALDEAIAAFEVAARLTDEYTGVPTTGPLTAPPTRTADPLAEAYDDFVASQPGFQALYHYRNALAARLSGTFAPSDATDDETPSPAE